MNSIKKTKGFTLIEIMVAVGILAIISAIAIPAYQNYVRSGRIQECANEVAAIRLAEEEFRMERDSYFAANGIAALEAASLGYYQSAFTTAAAILAANCVINVTAGGSPNGIQDSYTVTSIGQNELDATDTIIMGN